tara:strand:- start:242 stop:553 length:312 start_codon:yes stop_codon:yes gene_type:complete
MKDLTTQLTNAQEFRSYTEKLEEQFTQVNEMLKKVTTLLEQEKYKAIQVERAQRKHLISLDRMLNKTIDAHEVTKQRLLGYENEAGVPKSASEREAYMSYNPK